MRIGALVTLAQLAAHPLSAAALHRARRRRRGLGQSANPSCRHARRQSAATAALLVFPFGRASLRAQRRRPRASPSSGENQYHAVFGQYGCAIVHPSTVATALVAFDARVELRERPGRNTQRPAGAFLVGPEVEMTRENDPACQ